MTIQECYQALGGDYQQVLRRLPSESLVARFLGKFPADGSFAQLSEAMDAGDRELAFRAAHTLKGVCANLNLDRLFASASALTEVLRPAASEIPVEAASLFRQVCSDYKLTVDAIRAFQG